MRTTIRLDDQLLLEVKRVAAESGRSMTAVIEEALRLFLSQREVAKNGEAVELVTFSGAALLPGVDLDDSAALLELMED